MLLIGTILDIHYTEYLLLLHNFSNSMQFVGNAYIHVINAHRHLRLIAVNSLEKLVKSLVIFRGLKA